MWRYSKYEQPTDFESCQDTGPMTTWRLKNCDGTERDLDGNTKQDYGGKWPTCKGDGREGCGRGAWVDGVWTLVE